MYKNIVFLIQQAATGFPRQKMKPSSIDNQYNRHKKILSVFFKNAQNDEFKNSQTVILLPAPFGGLSSRSMTEAQARREHRRKNLSQPFIHTASTASSGLFTNGHSEHRRKNLSQPFIRTASVASSATSTAEASEQHSPKTDQNDQRVVNERAHAHRHNQKASVLPRATLPKA